MKCHFFLAIFAIIGLTLCPIESFGQNQDFLKRDVRSLNVEELSDHEIRQIIHEIGKSGMSEHELMEAARLRGMPQAQIMRLRQRIHDVQNEETTKELKGKDDIDLADEKKADHRRAAFTAPEGLNQIFGASLFNNEKLTFEPSLNIPTPQNYELGPGDEIVIDIWGNSKQNYRLTVNREGSINIDNLGHIYLNGLTIEQARLKIINRLSEIYVGLKGNNPSTYAQVSIGKIRSIKVTILGEVRMPGTYTLPSLSTVFNALYLSGGPSHNGSFRNIEVIRNGKVVSQIDVYSFLMGSEQESNIRIRDQDIIRVNPYQKRIHVQGEVKRPMIYEIREGEKLEDLIAYAAGFTDQAYTHRIKVRRTTSRERRIEDVEESRFPDFELQNGDIVLIEPVLERYENRVEIKGAVYRSGEYQLTDSLTIKTLINRAEGLRPDAFISRAMIFRTRDDFSTEVIPIDLELLMNDKIADVWLYREDVLHIPSIYDLREKYSVNIDGAVQLPGSFPFMENMTLEDLIVLAGGFTESASESRIEVARRVRTNSDSPDFNQIAEVFQFSVNKNLQIPTDEAIFNLQPFDKVFIRRHPGYEVQQTVAISGEVFFPGKYVLKSKNEYLSDLIRRSGGLTEYAYAEGAMLMRELNGDVSKVGIDLKKILKNPRSRFDLLVLPGDHVYIPQELQTVSIKGHVLNPIAIKYHKRFSFRDYVASAGGFTSDAIPRKAFVRYPDGSADRTRNLLFVNSYPKVIPGSEIYIPQRPERRSLSAQEVVGISTGIATLGLLIMNLLK